MQMISTVFYNFFWKVPYFTLFRVHLHDGRVLGLVVEVIILNWHYHSYYSHIFISQLQKLQDITAVPIININISIATNCS